MLSMDNCCGSAFCGNGKSPVDGKMIFSRQEGDGRSTRSPTLRCFTSSPTERIRPTPSLPRPAGKEGNLPYWPLIVWRTEPLIGAYSMATSTSLARGSCGIGELHQFYDVGWFAKTRNLKSIHHLSPYQVRLA